MWDGSQEPGETGPHYKVHYKGWKQRSAADWDYLGARVHELTGTSCTHIDPSRYCSDLHWIDSVPNTLVAYRDFSLNLDLDLIALSAGTNGCQKTG